MHACTQNVQKSTLPMIKAVGPVRAKMIVTALVARGNAGRVGADVVESLAAPCQGKGVESHPYDRRDPVVVILINPEGRPPYLQLL